VNCPKCDTELVIVDAPTKADMIDGATMACTVTMCLNCTWMRLQFAPSLPFTRASTGEKP
jgi:RNase P subunit RPR2